MEKGSKTRSEKSLLFKFVLVFLILLIIALIAGIIKEYLHQKELDGEMLALQEEIERLNLDKNSFLASIEAYQSEFFVEQEARLKFNLQKPGEKVLVIPQEKANTVVNSGLEVDSEAVAMKNTYVNNLRSWWSYFFQASENN